MQRKRNLNLMVLACARLSSLRLKSQLSNLIYFLGSDQYSFSIFDIRSATRQLEIPIVMETLASCILFINFFQKDWKRNQRERESAGSRSGRQTMYRQEMEINHNFFYTHYIFWVKICLKTDWLIKMSDILLLLSVFLSLRLRIERESRYWHLPHLQKTTTYPNHYHYHHHHCWPKTSP